ncbi:MAG: class I tRNA ligase family protein, partial [Candidatus Spechtbacteria bacterium]|nr:class I tRNA ligase family protein [Candidatus Spechtbacteria bacterium]
GEGIYFDISTFKDYGKLSRRTVEQAEDAVSRIDESVKKRNRGDFALWKSSKPGEPKWPSPWGEGRPGWHIEDTAITETEFGAQYDIHGGARDLIFPHHESEIAQMEAISAKKPLVNYWMHTGFLTINGQKMSKSLGNFITIHEFLEKHSKEVFRLFVLSSHYRSPIDYTEAAVKQAEENVRRLEEFHNKLMRLASPPPTPPLPAYRAGRLTKERGKEGEVEKSFYTHLDDDFNTPKALAALFDLVRDGNALLDEQKITTEDARQILDFLTQVNSISKIPRRDRRYKNQNPRNVRGSYL